MDSQLQMDSFKKVYDKIKDFEDVWFDIGIGMNMNIYFLEEIINDAKTPRQCLQRMLMQAIRHENLTWRKIYDALMSNYVYSYDARIVAEEILKEHSQTSDSSVPTAPVQSSTEKKEPSNISDQTDPKAPENLPAERGSTSDPIQSISKEESVSDSEATDSEKPDLQMLIIKREMNSCDLDEMEFKTKQVRLEFAQLLSTVAASFVKRNLPPRELTTVIRCYDKHYPLRSDINDITTYLINGSSFLEYDLLKLIIESSACLDKDRLALTEYEDKFKEYLRNRIHQEGKARATIMLDDEMDIGPANRKSIQALRDKTKKLLDIEELNVDFPEVEEVATKDKLPEESGILKGVVVIQEVTIEVLYGSHKEFNWEGYGLKLTVPKDALPKGIDVCRITIKASLSGQYDFPEDTELVSPVFWIRCEPRCKFQKQITLEIQHCAPPENSHRLFMTRASSTPKDLPYSFKVIHGGTFSKHTPYGIITLEHFCANAVIQERSDERCYWSGVFYMGPLTCREIHFAVTWHHDAHVTTVENHYSSKKAVTGPTQPLYFKGDKINLDVDEDGHVINEKWKIFPAIPPKVSKKEVDNHKEDSKIVPHCELVAQWKKKKPNQKPEALVYRVNIQGTTDVAFFTINIDPGAISQGTTAKDEESSKPKQVNAQSMPTFPEIISFPSLASGNVNLIQQIGNKYRTFGALLLDDKDGVRITSIETQMNKNADNINFSIFHEWLRGSGKTPVSWSTLIQVLKDSQLNVLANDIEQNCS